MAATFQSVATTAFTTLNDGNTLTISKPTGLAVGDLMVLHIAFGKVGGGGVAGLSFANTGWRDLSGTIDTFSSVSTSDEVTELVAYKVATSGDVAASDFSFTANGIGDRSTAGAIFRIDGQDPSPISAFLSGSSVNDATPTYATGITPTIECLILILTIAFDASTTSLSAYSLATDDPTWTERYDQANGAAVMSGATATRPQSTSTGAWSLTVNGGGGGTDSVSFIIAIRPIADVTVTPAVQVLAISQPAPAVSGGASVSPAVQVLTSSIPAPTISAKTTNATNQTKNSVSVTNQSKNAVSVTNQSKNSVSVTNQSKTPSES